MFLYAQSPEQERGTLYHIWLNLLALLFSNMAQPHFCSKKQFEVMEGLQEKK